MKAQIKIAILVSGWLISSFVRAGLYWEAGTQSNRPTVCFAGDAITSQVSRVHDIQTILQQFEYAGNVKFQYQGSCASTPANGKDHFNSDIRIVIPGTQYGTAYPDIFNTLNPIPGLGCTKNDVSSSWSWPPNTRDTLRECLFNLRLGTVSYNDAHFGDPSGGATPFLNDPLHEVGHALGLAHEHQRMDVDKDKVLTFIKQISGVSASQADAIYNAGYRAVESIRGPNPDDYKAGQEAQRDADIAAQVARLQLIPGYSNHADADALRLAAYNGIKNGTVQVASYGGGGLFYLTPYDNLSVMHYTFPALYPYAPGNYANTGLSEFDRLAIHILYPEDGMVAELAGNRVIRVGETIHHDLVLALRGAVIHNVLSQISWKVDGFTWSTGSSLHMSLIQMGNHNLTLSYTDFLGHLFNYTTTIQVLSNTQYRRQISGPMAAQYPALL